MDLVLRLSLESGMREVNVHDAKTHFSELLAAVERGEEIVICRRGNPVAKLVRHRGERPHRRLGTWAGKIVIKPGFYDEMTEAELAEWERPLSTPNGPN